jgi:hypothetical protein
MFVPIGGGSDERQPYAYCKEDGTFEMTTFEARDGAPEGEYTVLIEWRPALDDNPRERGPDKLGGKFFDPKTATLKVMIRSESNNLEPFRLTSPKTAGAPTKMPGRG